MPQNPCVCALQVNVCVQTPTQVPRDVVIELHIPHIVILTNVLHFSGMDVKTSNKKKPNERSCSTCTIDCAIQSILVPQKHCSTSPVHSWAFAHPRAFPSPISPITPDPPDPLSLLCALCCSCPPAWGIERLPQLWCSMAHSWVTVSYASAWPRPPESGTTPGAHPPE